MGFFQRRFDSQHCPGYLLYLGRCFGLVADPSKASNCVVLNRFMGGFFFLFLSDRTSFRHLGNLKKSTFNMMVCSEKYLCSNTTTAYPERVRVALSPPSHLLLT